MIHRILASSRQLILLAVICSFIASITVLIYGVIQTGNAIWQVLHDGAVSSKKAKKLVVSLVEVIDMFLL